MSESAKYDQNLLEFSEEFQKINDFLESLTRIYGNLPIDEETKEYFIINRLKIKSAWFACLVNSNIDELLIPEYLESKLSRNILIKKETEQFFNSIEQFKRVKEYKNEVFYDCIIYKEPIVKSTGFDLFSTQTPESSKCNPDLKVLFESWDSKNQDQNKLESIFYSFIEWHHLNNHSFSNQRQIILWLNFKLWKKFGPIALTLNLESFLHKNWNGKFNTHELELDRFLNFLNAECLGIQSELKSIYRKQIKYENFKSQQKIVSNYTFDKGFELNTLLKTEDSILSKLLKKKGFVVHSDFTDKSAIELHQIELKELLKKGVLKPIIEDKEIGLYINTSYTNTSNYLFKFQNIDLTEKEIDFGQFLQQELSKPILPIEILIESESLNKHDFEKRQKAFFG